MCFLLLLLLFGPGFLFGFGFDEVAAAVGRSEAACRQLVVRARRHMRAGLPRFEAVREERDRLAARFFDALRDGDVGGLRELLAAYCRAYNNWIWDFCEKDRKRLIPAGHVSLRNPEAAVAEVHRLAKKGFRAVFIAPDLIDGHRFSETMFDPFWQACEDEELPVGLHVVARPVREHAVPDVFDGVNLPYHVSMCFPSDVMYGFAAAMFEGLFERFPRLRMVLLEAGGLTLDVRTREVSVDGASTTLSSREFTLLEVLMRHPGQVLSQTQLLDQVWGYGFDGASNVVETYVRHLRRKIGAERIQTVRRAGYRLVLE